MPQQKPTQRKIIGKVMHDFKRGALRSGSGARVKNPKQAIAVALNEAGASRATSTKKPQHDQQRLRKKNRRARPSQLDAPIEPLLAC